mgnify:CR=1 FL=1
MADLLLFHLFLLFHNKKDRWARNIFLRKKLSAEYRWNISLPQITQMNTDFCFWTRISRITRIFISTRMNTDFCFEHEIRRRPTDQREVISRIARIFIGTRMNTDFCFEHETRRRPTDQREVISRITRMWIVWIREIRAIRVQKNKDLCRRYNLCKSVESAGERYLRNMNGV